MIIHPSENNQFTLNKGAELRAVAGIYPYLHEDVLAPFREPWQEFLNETEANHLQLGDDLVLIKFDNPNYHVNTPERLELVHFGAYLCLRADGLDRVTNVLTGRNRAAGRILDAYENAARAITAGASGQTSLVVA